MAGIRVSIPNINSQVRQATEVVDNLVKQRYKERQLEVGELFIQMCTKYVPWRTGDLARSGNKYVEGENRLRISWSKEVNHFNVAKIQYENTQYHHTDDRAAYWDKKMLEYEGELFYKKAGDIINK